MQATVLRLKCIPCPSLRAKQISRRRRCNTDVYDEDDSGFHSCPASAWPFVWDSWRTQPGIVRTILVSWGFCDCGLPNGNLFRDTGASCIPSLPYSAFYHLLCCRVSSWARGIPLRGIARRCRCRFGSVVGGDDRSILLDRSKRFIAVVAGQCSLWRDCLRRVLADRPARSGS